MAEKWKTFKHRVETVDGGWRATCATPKRAAQIVLEHNSHDALVETRTLLRDVLCLIHEFAKPVFYEKCEAALVLAEVKP